MIKKDEIYRFLARNEKALNNFIRTARSAEKMIKELEGNTMTKLRDLMDGLRSNYLFRIGEIFPSSCRTGQSAQIGPFKKHIVGQMLIHLKGEDDLQTAFDAYADTIRRMRPLIDAVTSQKEIIERPIKEVYFDALMMGISFFGTKASSPEYPRNPYFEKQQEPASKFDASAPSALSHVTSHV